MALTHDQLAGYSKRPDFSPAQPWRILHPPVLSLPRQPLRPGTHLIPSKAAANYLSIWGGWDDPNCARHSHPPTHWHAETCQLPWRGPSAFLCFSWREWPRLPFTARIERAPFHRAHSASKKGTRPLPPHSSQAARCASTGIVPATPPPFSASC
jgi:hypothetical protein